MEELRASTIRDVRSCLLTMKGMASLRQLAHDYETFVNQPIPYRQLGYKTLEEFVRSVDSLVVRKLPDGQLSVDARRDPSSAHISDMVARQKQAKKKRPTVARRPAFAAAPHDPMRWRPKGTNSTMRPAAMAYTQNVMRIQQQKQFIASPDRKPARNVNNNLPKVQRLQISPESTTIVSAQQESVSQPSAVTQASPSQQSQRVTSQPVKQGYWLAPLTSPQLEKEKASQSEKSNLARVMQRAKVSPPSTPQPPVVIPQLQKQQQMPLQPVENNQTWQNGTSALENSAEFIESGNPRKDFFNFVRFRRLDDPAITVLERKTKPHRRTQYDCKIKIDGQVFTSYGPEEFYDVDTATTVAVKEALAQLLKKYGRQRKSSLPVSAESSVMERIPSLVRKHFNGIWSWQVEADYKDQHHEELPPNWLKIVDASPIVTVEQFVDKFVLRICTPGDKGKSARKVLACDISIPTSSVTFDDKGYIMAKVTSPVSAGEIWCRQLNTPETESYDALIDEMNKYYQSGYETKMIQPESRIVKEGYYAAWCHTWHRVRALDMREDGVACLFVDVGEDLIVPFENIYALERRFAREHAQAFICRLAGLDAFYGVSQLFDAIMDLEDSDVTLEVVEDEVGEDAKKIFSVVMYDVETGTALNKDLLTSIARENATHRFETDKTFRVKVSYIPTNLPENQQGTLYAQIPSAGADILYSMLGELEQELPKLLPQIARKQPKITRDNCKGKVYFAKLDDDARYNRVQIIDSPPDFKFAQLLYIDHGRTRIVSMTGVQLHSLDVLQPALAKIPPQAIPVRMHITSKTMPTDLVAKMSKLLPATADVLLRVLNVAADGTPNVMVFVQNMDELVSVSDSVCMESYRRDAQISPGIINRFTPPDSPQNVPSTGILQSPKLPKSREYYEVKIPFAVNPWNFFVQPLASSAQLAEMQVRLQATFANRHLDAVNLRDIKDGNIYAAKYTDNVWYRVCVLKTIYPSAIVVFYVDFGYYENLNCHNLFALDKQFMALPYQAIKAKLAGIKPIREKWSVEDCKYFEQLVQHREYVSAIVSIEKDELYPCDNVLVLKLVDTTSSQQDVVIGDLLIQKRIAFAASTIA